MSQTTIEMMLAFTTKQEVILKFRSVQKMKFQEYVKTWVY